MSVRSIVIVGAGAAGLSLAYYLASLEQSTDFSCTLIDPDTKEQNDRTWAFWGQPFDFDHLVKKRWSYVDVLTPQRRVRRKAAGYRFIPADRFYRTCLEHIGSDPRFTFIRARAERIEDNSEGATVAYRPFGPYNLSAESQGLSAITADYVVDTVFGSGRAVTAEADDRERPHLRQSFVGWEVRTNTPVWEADAATLMDFSRSRATYALEFHYVLPERPDRALVEYTTVGESVPDDEYLEEQLEQYLDRTAGEGTWTIVRREKGTIPLFERTEPVLRGRTIYAGVASGAARPSTGYAFRSIVEQSKRLAEAFSSVLRHGNGSSPQMPRLNHTRRRPRFYDRVFLELLRGEPALMPEALASMFAGNSGGRVFRFLAGRSSLTDEARIVWSLPWPPFLKALERCMRAAARLKPKSGETHKLYEGEEQTA